MYPNIDAEQARLRLSNAKVADILKMHPYTYGQKKLHGGFSVEKSLLTTCSKQKPMRRRRTHDHIRNPIRNTTRTGEQKRVIQTHRHISRNAEQVAWQHGHDSAG